MRFTVGVISLVAFILTTVLIVSEVAYRVRCCSKRVDQSEIDLLISEARDSNPNIDVINLREVLMQKSKEQGSCK